MAGLILYDEKSNSLIKLREEINNVLDQKGKDCTIDDFLANYKTEDTEDWQLFSLKKSEAREKLNTLIMQIRPSILVSNKGALHRIPCADILYAESNKRVVNIVGQERICTVYMKMDQLEELVEQGFVRCHKSYLVNMLYIKYFSAEGIILENGKKIPVSRAKYRNAKECIEKFYMDQQGRGL